MYKIIFFDYTTFSGGKDLQNSQWNDMPNKLIRRIEYSLNARTITLENYESYNHLLMHGFDICSCKNNIFKVILLAKEKDVVKKITFNLINGSIIIEDVIYGKELNNSFTTGWKEGMKDLNPIFKLIR